jgi:hypothetical protein
MKCKKITVRTQCVRIEHPLTGIGIWRSKDEEGNYLIDTMPSYERFCKRHERFLTMYAEFYGSEYIGRKPKLLEEHFCAFKSIDQLLEWVLPKELKEMIELDFRVYLIETSECLEGEFQIAFRKEAIIEKKDITQLFK